MHEPTQEYVYTGRVEGNEGNYKKDGRELQEGWKGISAIHNPV